MNSKHFLMRGHLLLGILFLGICLLFFLICVFLGSHLLFYHQKEDNRNEEKKEVNLFQYFEKDYLRNETSFGIVSIFEEIDQFISYDDVELQQSVLISSFGTEEFECHGSCYCENDEFRRISQSKVLIEGVSYLLAAVSSVVAFNIAKEYFSEKCSEKYSNICESKSIKSEVENCEKIVSENFIEERTRGEKRTYFCYGNCLDHINHGTSRGFNKFLPTAKEEGLDCKKLKFEGKMHIYSNELIVYSESLSTQMRQTARKKFQDDKLSPFCKENSQIEYEYQQPRYKMLKNGKKRKYYFSTKRIGSMCVGTRRKKSQQNVRCRQIEPEPTSPNTAYWDKRWWDEKREWDEM